MWKKINFDDVTNQNIKKHNPNWPQIPDHPYRILITTGSGSGKIKFFVWSKKSATRCWWNLFKC